MNLNKKKLEIALQGLSPHPNPSPDLEQYTTPAGIASDVLFTSLLLGDLEGKKVIDLGCGTGIFAIGAKLLGAEVVVGVDVDENAIATAKKNADSLGLDVEFMVCDIREFKNSADTVFQNPPFGSQKKHADVPFLEKALDIGDVVYTIHLLKTEEFIRQKVTYLGSEITHEKGYEFEIKHMFSFHTKEKKNFDVKMFRMIKSGGETDKS
jgi:putative methylase